MLIVPPFAEEMNKSRKMFAEIGQALRARGVATVIVDPYGTGDSDGEFREASYAGWLEDLGRAATWSAEEGWPVTGLLCVRFGCLLGAQFARDAGHGVGRTVFWQPVVDGERFLMQFLRTRVAASMMATERETVGDLRQRLRSGETLEIAGYELSPAMALELASIKLGDLVGTHLGELHWTEIVGAADGSISAASEPCLEIARTRGQRTHVRTVVGAPFWAATEIVRIGALIDSTVETLSRPPWAQDDQRAMIVA